MVPEVREYQSVECSASRVYVYVCVCVKTCVSISQNHKERARVTLANLLKSVWVHHGAKHLWVAETKMRGSEFTKADFSRQAAASDGVTRVQQQHKKKPSPMSEGQTRSRGRKQQRHN